MGHTFVYLQDAVQDCRAVTIQLLADAQQGRQAVQVRQKRPVETSMEEHIPQSYEPRVGGTVIVIVLHNANTAMNH